MATKQKQTKTTKARSPRKSTKTPAPAGAGAKATDAAKAPKAARRGAAPRKGARDPRLPAAGTTLVRPYKGKDVRVTVLEQGFRWERKEYRSLSALASAVTGQASINGFLWFKLTGSKAAKAKAGTTPKPRKRTKRTAEKPAATGAPETAPAATT